MGLKSEDNVDVIEELERIGAKAAAEHLRQKQAGSDNQVKTKKKRGRGGAQRQTQRPNIVTQFPFWPDAARAVPNDLTRSALFTVQNRNTERKLLNKAIVATFGDTEIHYTGEELRQDDLDVWTTLHHFARSQPINRPIIQRPLELINELRWPVKGDSYTRLKNSIVRLKENGIQIKSHSGLFGGSLIANYAFKPDDSLGIQDPETEQWIENGFWAIWLDVKISQMFKPDSYTLLEYEIRRKIKSEIGKWLHAYYRGHAEPFPVFVATLRAKCGSSCKTLWEFRRRLKNALSELLRVGFLESYEIDDEDKVHVKRKKLIAPNP